MPVPGGGGVVAAGSPYSAPATSAGLRAGIGEPSKSETLRVTIASAPHARAAATCRERYVYRKVE